jgi:hypothetical protein
MRRVRKIFSLLLISSILTVAGFPALGTDDGIFTPLDDHLPGQHNIGVF